MTLAVNASITGTLSRTADLADVSARLASAVAALTYAQGTGAAECDLVYADTATIAASTTVDLDMAGALVTPLGTACVFAKIKAILVLADSANTNNVVVGGDAAGVPGIFGDLTDTVVVQPGGVFLWADPTGGATVTASTGDIIQVANSSSGTSVTYSIVVLGASA